MYLITNRKLTKEKAFKMLRQTSENSTSNLIFDNICLVGADTNNENHINWVGSNR